MSLAWRDLQSCNSVVGNRRILLQCFTAPLRFNYIAYHCVLLPRKVVSWFTVTAHAVCAVLVKIRFAYTCWSESWRGVKIKGSFVQHLVGSYLCYDLSAVYNGMNRSLHRMWETFHKSSTPKQRKPVGRCVGTMAWNPDNPTKSMKSQHTYCIATLQKTTYPVPTHTPTGSLCSGVQQFASCERQFSTSCAKAYE